MPRSTWFRALLLFVALWAPLSQADTGWQPISDTIRKSDKDTRQYQAVRLDNDMVVLLVSDPQAVKSLSALVVPVGSLEDPETHQGLAHYLEHMCLMGSKNSLRPIALRNTSNCTVAVITPVPRRTVPRSIWKLKTMRFQARLIVLLTRLQTPCWIKIRRARAQCGQRGADDGPNS